MRILRERLRQLKAEKGLLGLKGGTEVEANSFEEIYLMRRISEGIVPLTVKIGGPEARNDIEFMLAVGVDTILAPMVESAYSLKNFVETMAALDPEKRARLAINIETITAFYNLNAIYESPAFARISQVTVGRSDLAGSMGQHVDDPEVMHITREIIAYAAELGKDTSVGGQVTTENALLVREKIGSDYLNTRHMLVLLDQPDLGGAIEANLAWEKDFYTWLRSHFPERREFYANRVRSIEERIRARRREMVPAGR